MLWLSRYIIVLYIHKSILTLSNGIYAKVMVLKRFMLVYFTSVTYFDKITVQNHSILIQGLETVQDFLIKLNIKQLMHLLKISIFSLINDILILTKIMINLVKDCKIRTLKVIFQCLKLVESFQFFFLWRIFD